MTKTNFLFAFTFLLQYPALAWPQITLRELLLISLTSNQTPPDVNVALLERIFGDQLL